MRLSSRAYRQLTNITVLAAAGCIAVLAPANAVESATAESEHAHDHATTVSRSTVAYETPAVILVRDDGKSVSLPGEMDDGRPVVLNFIFTTCTAVCPLMSRTLSEFQTKLGAGAAAVHVMSISIDPEQDSPARLAEYARRFHAGPEWQHYTGTLAASLAAQRAFDVYRGDKMSHTAVTLLRAAPGQPWLRIDGFVTPDELVHDYRALLAAK